MTKRAKISHSPLDLGSLHQGLFHSYFSRVLFHIHDPRTWYSFSLTCRVFSKLCEHEADDRMVEFNAVFSYENLFGNVKSHSHIPDPSLPCILPNGRLHGIVTHYNTEIVNVINGRAYSQVTGKIKYYAFLWKGKFIVSLYPKEWLFISAINPEDTPSLSSRYCVICRKFHIFSSVSQKWILFGDGLHRLQKEANICLGRRCDEENLRIMSGEELDKLWDRQFRAESIIDLAKRIKSGRL